MVIIKILLFLAFLGSIAWLISSPSYEPAILVITSLAAIIAAFYKENNIKKKLKQNQSVAKGAFGIQAGGDVKIGTLPRESNSDD